jgi:hypothetical protein
MALIFYKKKNCNLDIFSILTNKNVFQFIIGKEKEIEKTFCSKHSNTHEISLSCQG